MVLTFSVITPSYQQDKFIEKTIKSVLSQGVSDIDYVICDGGSNDKTLSILERHSSSLRWVSEPDRGQAHAINKGLAMTQGDIIAWINSDDVYYPQALIQVLKFFEMNPSVSAVYGQADWIDEFDNIIAPYPTQSWNYKQLTRECYLCQPAVFFRRNLVERLGTLNADLEYCMDYELWLRYGQTVSFAYLPIKLAGSRIYSTNKTFGNRLAAHREANEMLYEKIGYSTRHWIFEYSKLEIESDGSLEKLSLIWVVKFLITAIKKCWKFNRWAVPIVALKVLTYPAMLSSKRLRYRSFDVEGAISKQRDRA
ncbi:MAG: glycosyltransferase family 2 protein [Cyanobacteria bacterium P01_H01_bin.26]